MSRAAVAILLLLGPALARAEPAADPHAAARLTFEAGNVAYAAGHYPEAATAYEEAYRLQPLPAILFSAAQAYRRRFYDDPDPRWLQRARELYRDYLEQDPQGTRHEHSITHLATIDALLTRLDAPEPLEGAESARGTQLMISSRTPGARGRIDAAPAASVPVIADVEAGAHEIAVEAPGFFPARETHVAVAGRLVVASVDLRARPGTLRLRAPTDASIHVDGRDLGAAPIGPVSLSAGRHRVVVTARGQRPFDRSLLLARGEERTVVATLSSTAQRRVAWIGFGVAGASLAASALTGGLAIAAQDRAEEDQAPLGHGENISDARRGRYEDDLAARNDLRAASISLLCAGVALAVTGAILYFVDEPATPR